MDEIRSCSLSCLTIILVCGNVKFAVWTAFYCTNIAFNNSKYSFNYQTIYLVANNDGMSILLTHVYPTEHQQSILSPLIILQQQLTGLMSHLIQYLIMTYCYTYFKIITSKERYLAKLIGNQCNYGWHNKRWSYRHKPSRKCLTSRKSYFVNEPCRYRKALAKLDITVFDGLMLLWFTRMHIDFLLQKSTLQILCVCVWL